MAQKFLSGILATAQVNITRTGNAQSTTLVLQDNARIMKLGRDAIDVYNVSDGTTATHLYLQGNGGHTTFGGNITTNGLSATAGSFTQGVTIADVIDGPFTALRLMNQKTYGSGTGTNEKVRFVMGISESAVSFAGREGFAIELGIGAEGDSSDGVVDFKVRDGGTLGTYQTVNGHNKSVEFAGSIHTAGNLGIGTAPTSRQLSVFRTTAGSIANFLHYTDATTFQGLYIQVSQATNDVIFQSSGSGAGGFKFYAGNAEKAGIDASGNITLSGTVDGVDIAALAVANTGDQTLPTDFVSAANGGTFLGDVTVDSTHFTLKDGSPELYFHTEGNHYNWLVAAQENVDGAFEIGHSSATATALDQDASNYTRALTLHPTSGATFAGDVKIQKNTPLLELGTSNSSTGNAKITFFSKNNSSANAYSLQFNKDTGVDRLEFIDGSGNANIKFNNGGSATFASSVTSSSGTSVFSVVNASAYQLNGTYIVDSSRNLVNISQLRFGGSDASIDTASVSSATATTVVASVVHATYAAAFFDFVIKNGTNVRAGVVYACHDGTTVSFTETSTVDLGDTSDVTLNVVISGTNMNLEATTTSSTWTIKSLIRTI